MGQTQPLFDYFRPFHSAMTNTVQNLTINRNSMDVVLGIRTRDHRMVGADASTELSVPPLFFALAFVPEKRLSSKVSISEMENNFLSLTRVTKT